MLELATANHLFFASISAFLLGATASLVLRRHGKLANWFGNGLAIIGSALGMLSGIKILFTGEVFIYSFNSSMPYLSLIFNLDKLAAFFVFVISLIAFFASIYALGYVGHYKKKYSISTLGFFYNFFIAAMLLVIASANILFFFIAWEIMALSSYFLVVYEREDPQNISAGFLYFVMTHIGTGLILIAFLLLYKATGFVDFVSIKENASAISPALKNAIFVLAFLGFGIKAGIIPLHLWLPSAHPAAPSHVSALMSGVMIKTGIYMMIRVLIDILPQPPLWWGIMVLIFGAISSLLGVLYALTEHDIKRLLAYHSIENIGIILLGVGSALTFLSLNHPTFAAFSLVAGLFHTLNHANFKALLFLSAGAVTAKTHTRNIEEFGGLIKKMPQTAIFFLVGAMAISALPPLNGFFSEWLTFQSLFAGLQSDYTWVNPIFLIGIVSLAFSGGLAAACFVKAFGATFLARARSEEASEATEVSLFERFGMGGLAVLTLVIGLSAGFISAVLLKIAGPVLDLTNFEKINFNLSYVKTADDFAGVSMPAVFILLIIVLGLIYGITKIFRKKVKIGETWDCGKSLTPRMEITATGFSRAIVTIFKGILKPSKQHTIEYHDADTRYFQKTSTVNLMTEDVHKSYLYDPLKKLADKLSERIKLIQGGNPNVYILYILIMLLLLLLITSY